MRLAKLLGYALFFSTLWAHAQTLQHAINVQSIVLDGRGSGTIFEGLGAVSAGASSRLLIDYPEPQRSQILDYLFKPGYGAALQHLKVEIGSDVNSTDGSEPSQMRTPSDHNYTRGYEWWLMEEARKRNPKIILDSLPWGAPGWIGNGTFYSPDMAGYVADFLQGARKEHGLDIAYTGIWNEKVYNADYVKELHRTLLDHKIATRIVCCDEYPGEGSGQWAIVDAEKKDHRLQKAIAAITVHYPWIYNDSTTPLAAKLLDKPLWSSEDQPNSGGGPIVSRDWDTGGRVLAKLYNRNYLEGGFTKTEIWSPVTSYYDILAAPNSGLMYANTPWSGHYDVQSTIWVTAHTTQFAQPGWRYLQESSGYLARGGSFVTLVAPNRRDWSTVLESIDAMHIQTVRFAIQGELSKSVVHVWETNHTKTFVHVADIKPADGIITLRIDPNSLYSLTSTMGQGKGTATPPQPAPFPFPYSDDFEAVSMERSPRYLSDQDGAFEVQPCIQRPGKCMEQVIVTKPIPWSPLPDPFTLAGSSSWKNYKVAVDVRIPNAGVATIIGRIDSANVFSDSKALLPSGYDLAIGDNGRWQLLSTEYKKATQVLASGNASFANHSWHHLELVFHDEEISAFIDGHAIASVTNKAHASGMFGVGSNWSTVQFDNLSVTP